jgi:hypothetical protein
MGHMLLLPTIVTFAMPEIIQIHQTHASVAIQPIIIMPIIQTIKQPNSRQIANHVIQRLRGRHQHLTMMDSIFLSIVGNTAENGVHVLNVIQFQQTTAYFPVLFVMNTAIQVV